MKPGLPLLFLLLAAEASWAQLALVRPDGANDIAIPAASIDVGSTSAGDFIDTRLRIRNTGSAAAVVSTLEISGVGFSLQGDPSLPLTLAPGSNADFRARFRPPAPGSYSATLRVNRTLSLLLRGSAAAGLVVLLERERTMLTNGQPVEFGSIVVGQRGRIGLLLRNDAPSDLDAPRIGVTGAGYSAAASSLPGQVKAGAEARFDVFCEPLRPGFTPGVLTINNWSFPLNALAAAPREPDVPPALFEFDPDAARSGKQAKLRVKLSAPAPTAAAGMLRLEFTPAVEAGAGDEAIQFLGNSSRELPLAIAAGSSEVTFQGKPDILFQTGTTAGTAVFRLKLGTEEREVQVAIPAEAPRVDLVELKRSAGTVEVVLTGFDNHRSAGNVVFVFTDAAGQELPAVSAEAGSLFASHFRASALGGVFRLRASFPVTGDASRLARVAVKIANSIGASSGKSE